MDWSWLYGALIVALSLWVLHSFLHALLVACVIGVASWPLYERFAARMPRRAGRGATALAFTALVSLFVLAPLMFAFGALLTELRELLFELAAADRKGLAVPGWLDTVPLGGPWLAERWQSGLARPGTLLGWAERADAAALLGWAQSLGQFMARHALIIAFSLLALFFLYRQGDVLAGEIRLFLRHAVGEQAERYVHRATRAVRASVNSMLLVGLFDGLASGAAYALAGVPHPATWAAITGALALVPFLGYAAVLALTLQLSLGGAAGAAPLAFALGCAILFIGDKVVRPALAREGTHLPFVWVLMGCFGGFEALGPEGLVIGPVALALARQLWVERVLAISSGS